jgi:hypothetical protein
MYLRKTAHCSKIGVVSSRWTWNRRGGYKIATDITANTPYGEVAAVTAGLSLARGREQGVLGGVSWPIVFGRFSWKTAASSLTRARIRVGVIWAASVSAKVSGRKPKPKRAMPK